MIAVADASPLCYLVLIGEFGWNPLGQGIRNDIPGLMDELKP